MGYLNSNFLVPLFVFVFVWISPLSPSRIPIGVPSSWLWRIVLFPRCMFYCKTCTVFCRWHNIFGLVLFCLLDIRVVDRVWCVVLPLYGCDAFSWSVVLVLLTLRCMVWLLCLLVYRQPFVCVLFTSFSWKVWQITLTAALMPQWETKKAEEYLAWTKYT